MRRTTPIALGSWRPRRSSAPAPRKSDFEPFDRWPSTDSAQDAVNLRLAGQQEIAHGESLRRQMIWGAGRLSLVHANAMRRREPRWSTERAVKAISRFLDEIGGWVLGGGAGWSEEMRGALLETVPGVAEPIATLEQSREEMLQRGSLWQRDKAAELTRRAFAAAGEVSELVERHCRALPGDAGLPFAMAHRLRPTSRSQALLAAVDRYDAQVEAWYAFLFSSPAPSHRESRLAHISEESGAGAEAEACKERRHRCRELADAEKPPWGEARQALKELRAALRSFEEAIYRSLA